MLAERWILPIFRPTQTHALSNSRNDAEIKLTGERTPHRDHEAVTTLARVVGNPPNGPRSGERGYQRIHLEFAQHFTFVLRS